MALEISFATVGVSASISIITSYFGTLINFSRLRNRHRRALGLSLLAEIKMLQRRLRHHYQIFEATPESLPKPFPRLSVTTADTTVFTNGSGNLGLFTTRTAVEVLEYYNAVRGLAAQAQALTDLAATGGDSGLLLDAIAEHLRSIRLARHHSRLVVIALRRDTPMTTAELLRYGFRRVAVFTRRASRRLRFRHTSITRLGVLTKTPADGLQC